MSEPRYIVGIDLGTTNSAVAFVDRQAETKDAEVSVFSVLQVEKVATTLAEKTLPSFLYLAGPGELPPGALDLPWAEDRSFAVGRFARERGKEVSLRLVSSAKSWLSHGAVDRKSALLPFGSPDEVQKVSPIEASKRYLEHIRDAWDAEHPEHRLGDQRVFLTVPASFDAVARQLTLEAAEGAGLRDISLLEEPQAAFYAWLDAVKEGWRTVLQPGDRVLVSDVGGGTTDFSLIEVTNKDGGLALERVAVGDHILLGGDNMDLALAHVAAEKLRGAGKKLDAGQDRQLVAAARAAKEHLLTHPDEERAAITLLGRGSKLIGGKLETELLASEVKTVLLDGFFPSCERSAKPIERARTGFLELGLPFAQDAGITRHLAAFLARNADAPLPTHVLLNGGVMNSPVMRERLMSVLQSWGSTPRLLEEADYDLAVARGAAYYGATKDGRGIRIKSATARAYYVGIESAAPAVPGVKPPIKALCVVPMGVEEGTESKVPGLELGLVVGQPVEFRLFSSSQRPEDRLGTVLSEYDWPDVLEETAPLSLTLPPGERAAGTVVPVRLEVKITEVGTVRVESVSTDGKQRFPLSFDVRERVPS